MRTKSLMSRTSLRQECGMGMDALLYRLDTPLSTACTAGLQMPEVLGQQVPDTGLDDDS